MSNTQEIIAKVCDEIKEFLIEKNKAYGDSAINPIGIFSDGNALENINIRIDDKLNRIKNKTKYEGDDDEKDLIGYLILKQVVYKTKRFL